MLRQTVWARTNMSGQNVELLGKCLIVISTPEGEYCISIYKDNMLQMIIKIY